MCEIPSNVVLAEEFAKIFDLDLSKKWIGFLPGSREMEINKMLPIFLKTIQQFENEEYEFIISKSRAIKHQLFMSYIDLSKIKVKIIDGHNYEMMKYSDFLTVTSGTATLEAAYLQTPLIVIYKAAKISYEIAKKLVRIKYIGLPNIIAEKEIVPELIQENADPIIIYNKIKYYLDNEDAMNEIKENLLEIKELLTDLKPSQKVADLIEKVLRDSVWN